MRIVITGAMGHIGSRLIRDLPRAISGAEIVMIDNLVTQRFPALFNLPAEGTYRFRELDICQDDLSDAIAGADALVHLAASTDATTSFDRAEEVERNNLDGTRRVAEFCAAAGVRFFFASTTSVYGAQSGVVSEDCPPEELRPQSPYATAKLAAEQALTRLAQSDGLRHVTCRFGTIFGISPGMRFHTAVNKFCWQAVMGEPLSVWRTAMDQKRPYLDLGDCVRAIAFALRNDLFDGRVYNVLTVNATVRDIVDKIHANLPDCRVAYVDSAIMNQLSYEVSDTAVRARGFAPEGSLHQGIADTIALLRQANRG